MRGLAYAIEHLLFPMLVALLFFHLFRDAPAGANGYVEQINHWFGFDELARALGARL